MPAQLPQDYYLRNFRQLLAFVAQRYWTLLSEREQRFYQAFVASTEDAQRLYIRLLSGRGNLKADELIGALADILSPYRPTA